MYAKRLKAAHPVLRNLSDRILDTEGARYLRLGMPPESLALRDADETQTRIMEPDLFLISQAREEEPGNLAGKVELVIDVDVQACGGSPDYSQSIRIYQNGGVEQYWIIYPKDEILVVRTRKDGVFGPPVVFGEGDLIESPGAREPIPVERFFERRRRF